MVAHSALTGADLHEPKGAAAASAGQIYVANGSASGAWQKIGSSELDTAELFDLNEMYLTGVIDDVSTAADIYFAVPHNATLNKVITVLGGAITVADAVVTVANHAASTIGTITVAQSGSAAGDVDTLAASVNNTFTEDQRVKVSTDGASTGAQKLYITLIFTKTA
jgi:hypothetical protein